MVESFAKLILSSIAVGFIAFCAVAVGCLLGILTAMVIALPLYFLWNHVAPIYLTSLPPVWQNIAFWELVWICWTVIIIRNLVFSVKVRTKDKDE